ncbi:MULTISPECIES: DUF2335 domain-containing protein [unclassified Sphingomonas]|uniref:DUF2335 domain-containing protein n=1 Tax=Novosphingobium rhizosphaerae TaxID=1551649 RepID=UPI0015CE9CBA
MTNNGSEFEKSHEATIEQSIAQTLQPFVQPGKTDQAVRAVTTVFRKVHQGPLPAPEDLGHYESVMPGAAERIFQLTEREQAHRHEQEKSVFRREYRTRYIGQAGAILIAFGLMGVVVFCAYVGQPVTAGVISAIGIAAAVFIKHTAQRNERVSQEDQRPVAKKKPGRTR